MSALGDRLKEQRQKAREGALHHIDVPAWGEEVEEPVEGGAIGETRTVLKPLRIYFRPYTLAEEKKIRNHAKGDVEKQNAYAVIFKALDENGKPLFDVGDLDWMIDTERSDVITDITLAMGRATDDPDPVKNS